MISCISAFYNGKKLGPTRILGGAWPLYKMPLL